MTPLAFLDIFSGPELILVLAVVLIFFGGDKMPEFARGLAKIVREFRKAASDVEGEFKRVLDEHEQTRPRPPITVAPPPRLPAAWESPAPASVPPPPAAAAPAPAASESPAPPAPAPDAAPEGGQD